MDILPMDHAFSENRAPTQMFGGHGGLNAMGAPPTARKVGLGGVTPFGAAQGTPAAGKATGGLKAGGLGARTALGNISNIKSRPAPTQPDGTAAKKMQRSGGDEVAAVFAAAADLDFSAAAAEEKLPPMERMYHKEAELAGPVSLDRSGFNADAAVESLLRQQQGSALGALGPYVSRAHRPTTIEVLYDDDAPADPRSVSFDVGPAPLTSQDSSTSAMAPAAEEPQADDAREPLADGAADNAADDVDVDNNDALEMPIDLAQFELEPPTPRLVRSDDEEEESDEEDEEDANPSVMAVVAASEADSEVMRPVEEGDGAVVLDLSDQLAGL